MSRQAGRSERHIERIMASPPPKAMGGLASLKSSVDQDNGARCLFTPQRGASKSQSRLDLGDVGEARYRRPIHNDYAGSAHHRSA
jgi:hypothetical protein